MKSECLSETREKVGTSNRAEMHWNKCLTVNTFTTFIANNEINHSEKTLSPMKRLLS